MSRRLLLGYVGLTIFVLAVLVIPLGVSNARNERQNLTTKVERDAVALAALSEDTLEGTSDQTAALTRVATSYQEETGGRVVVVDAEGDSIVDSADLGGEPRSFASRPEVAQALSGEVATGTRSSVTLGTDLLYVAVPVASSGVVHGAVRVTYPLSAVNERVLEYWLILAAISAVVLVVATVVGLRLARSIARPLADVERAASAAGAGDLTARAPEDEGPSEVRSLAGSFNHMVGTVDELVRSREAFVADASHQLRTPLQALRLRLENLERDVAPEARGDLDAALAEVGRLSHLVDGLLALARTDSTTGLPSTLDLCELVRERVDAWTALAAEQGVELRADAQAPSLVLATPGRLEQVLDNLFANALEVSPAGSVVEVSTAPVDGWVEMHVVDEGPGMSEEQRARAFDRFWRAGTSAGGSGLGLAIVERLVSADGGTVELRAAAGGGLDAVVRLRPAAVPLTAQG